MNKSEMETQMIPDFSSPQRMRLASVHRQNISMKILEPGGEDETSRWTTKTEKVYVKKVKRAVSP